MTLSWTETRSQRMNQQVLGLEGCEDSEWVLHFSEKMGYVKKRENTVTDSRGNQPRGD